MTYFVDYVKAYLNVNKKGKQIGEFMKSFDRLLIPGEFALASLHHQIEMRVKELDAKYPRTKKMDVKTFKNDDGGSFYVGIEGDVLNHICILNFKIVKGSYSSKSKEEEKL